jgi:hypothetical protein
MKAVILAVLAIATIGVASMNGAMAKSARTSHSDARYNCPSDRGFGWVGGHCVIVNLKHRR